MATPRFRAWHFTQPDLDPVEGFGGPQTSATGGIEMIAGDASVRQAILLLLSTSPGERVMRPAYGCDLDLLTFNPNDDTTAGLAIHYVRRALQRWEPRIEILHLGAEPNPDDPGRLDIVLDYRVRATASQNRLVFPFNLLQSEV